ncbi:MAG: DNA methyltransferase [Crocosphaera sp.]
MVKSKLTVLVLQMYKQLELSLSSSLSEQTEKVDLSSTFTNNMKLPIHRWFRFSAGFSAEWVEKIIDMENKNNLNIFDPFAGSGTTLIVAEKKRVKSYGIEAHPFIFRIAQAKLLYKTNPDDYWNFIQKMIQNSKTQDSKIDDYPELIYKCFTNETLTSLDKFRRALQELDDNSPQSKLAWLTLIAIIRSVSHVGTAPWQYVLPNKTKKNKLDPISGFSLMAQNVVQDMRKVKKYDDFSAKLINSDARTCKGIADNSIDLIITSPPYANNYDYADATRLEMCFMKEITNWGDLKHTVRKNLVRSCSQQVTNKNVNLEQVLNSPELEVIKTELVDICNKLYEERKIHGGRKNYHLMIPCYFLDMAQVWLSLRRVCKYNAKVCFVIGDSAPYGIYVPVIEWLGLLAKQAGFRSFEFSKTRDRNIKWKNRKHRVPLCEGHLWVQG